VYRCTGGPCHKHEPCVCAIECGSLDWSARAGIMGGRGGRKRPKWVMSLAVTSTLSSSPSPSTPAPFARHSHFLSSSSTITMLQRQTIRRLHNVAGRSRLPNLKPPRVPLFQHRELATPAAPPSPNDLFANGTNAYYAEEMYRHWRQDPSSVHVSWDAYFSGLDKGLGPNAFQPPPRFLPAPADGAPALHASGGAQLDDHLKVSYLLVSASIYP